jgi:uncharacterized protein
VLIEFKVANFRSIREEQTLSFIANSSDELPDNLIVRDLPGLTGAKFLKGIGIYGANASGKSNLLAALRFLATFVRDSATNLDPTASTGAEPFKLDSESAALPSQFEISALINDMRILYGLHVTRKRVVNEYLAAYPKGKPQVWFEREWDSKSEKYEWSKATPNFKHDDALREKVRENAAFISAAAQWNQEQATMVWKWFDQNLRFLDLSGGILDASLTFDLVKDRDARLRVIKLLRGADLGISDIRVREAKQKRTFQIKAEISPRTEEDPSTQKIAKSEDHRDLLELFEKGLRQRFSDVFNSPILEFLHQAKGEALVPLNFASEESAGTRRYFAMIGEWLRGQDAGRTVLVDELESSLHPLLVRELLNLLFAGASNASYMQIVFTTHNPLLLDQSLLRRDQIWFTEKDQDGATRLYPLTDFKPRRDESLVRGYLAGRYGGIPFIPEGLCSNG